MDRLLYKVYIKKLYQYFPYVRLFMGSEDMICDYAEQLYVSNGLIESITVYDDEDNFLFIINEDGLSREQEKEEDEYDA